MASVDVITRLENHKVLHIPAADEIYITNAGSPINATDLANKAYVDNNGGGGGTTGSWYQQIDLNTGSNVATKTGDTLTISGGGVVDIFSSNGSTIIISGAVAAGGIAGSIWVGSLWVASEAQGDILYRDANRFTRLGAGNVGSLLKTSGAGANPFWGSAPEGPAGPAGATESYIGAGNAAGLSDNNVAFLNPNTGVIVQTNGSEASIIIPRAGSIEDWYVFGKTNDTNIRFTLEKNGTLTALLIDIPTTEVTGSNVDDIVLVEPGDRLSIEASGALGGTIFDNPAWGMRFT